MSIDPYASPAANVSPMAKSYEIAIMEGAIRQLAGTKPWVRFISVMMFIGAAFLVLTGVVMMSMGGVLAQAVPNNQVFAGGLGFVVGAVYLVMALFHIYPGLRLWKYASRIGDVMRAPTSANLEAALQEQRKFWKFVGVVVLVFVILYALAIVGFIVMAMTGVIKAQGA